MIRLRVKIQLTRVIEFLQTYKIVYIRKVKGCKSERVEKEKT